MLTKFESKSNRVKGLSFHPHRPWILSSLHNGIIQLWDYRMSTLLDKFEEHDGPVRGVDFHKSQPLFVSGGDDYKIKVWNYKMRRCLFTLLGHLDYIRTVQFHQEYPWIVSASDDQTIRIWNWQSRTCISVLTGHNHYVMCAAFHPKDDLVVSASLDQTVRVWDTSGLRRKTVHGVPSSTDEMMGGSGGGGPGGNNAVISRVNADLFGGTDAIVKYVLEGHDRGVNWASFHHSLPLIISGADDRQVKLWRMNETKAWEVDTMRGHNNNVSSVIFHPRAELILSNSEDRSIRVWDISKRLGVQTFRRENDRFWMLAAHPTQNLLAAGHDNGTMVFKLERERPAFDSNGGQHLYVIKDRYLRWVDYESGKDVPLIAIRRPAAHTGTTLDTAPRSLEYNKLNTAECNLLLFYSTEGGMYELFTLPGAGGGAPNGGGAAAGMGSRSTGGQDSRRGSALAAVFVSRQRFAVLEKNRTISIKKLDNISTRRINPPHPGTDGLFSAGTSGRVLIRAEDKITLFDIEALTPIAEITAPRVKYVVWNDKSDKVALISKQAIAICGKNLEQSCTVAETTRIKGGAWTAQGGVFIYSTLNHIKYTLPNGDSGIVRTLDDPVYITTVRGNVLFCIDREGKMRQIVLDLSECLFKVALINRQYGEVMQLIRKSRFCGRAIIGYLQEKGFPEVALHFVQDKKTRFNLALECGNIEVATQAATEVDDPECWRKLGAEALRQGNHKLVEKVYQKTSDMEKLSFLYLITGNRTNLTRMLKIAESRKDVMSQFHNALYLGNVGERVRLLESVGQQSLAFVTAATHGLTEHAERLQGFLVDNDLPVPQVNNTRELLLPPVPVCPLGDRPWPLLDLGITSVFGSPSDFKILTESEQQEQDNKNKPASSIFSNTATDASGGAAQGGAGGGGMFDDEDPWGEPSSAGQGGEETAAKTTWDSDGDDDSLFAGDSDSEDVVDTMADGAAGVGGDAGDAELMDSLLEGVFVPPPAGMDPTYKWCDKSNLAADHASAGAFREAMRLLNGQIGVVNFAPLKPLFADLYMGTRCLVPGVPSLPAMQSLVQRVGSDGKRNMPQVAVKLAALKAELVNEAFRLFQKGPSAPFTATLEAFRMIMRKITLVVVGKQEVRAVTDLLAVCREYSMCILILLAKADAESKGPDGAVRNAELAAYSTHCVLEQRDVIHPLKRAMKGAYKSENFIAAASFARRLLQHPEMSKEAQAKERKIALKVLQTSEQRGRNKMQLNYDDSQPFTVCCHSFTPLYRGDAQAAVKCPFCSATAAPEFAKKLCNVCQLSALGEETIGLVCTVDELA